MNAFRNRISLLPKALFGAVILLAVYAEKSSGQAMRLTAERVDTQTARLNWEHGPNDPKQYEVSVFLDENKTQPVNHPDNPFDVPAGRAKVGDPLTVKIDFLEATPQYFACVLDGDPATIDLIVEIPMPGDNSIAIGTFPPAAGQGNGLPVGAGNGGFGGFGNGNNNNMLAEDPLAARMSAASEFLEAQGEYMTAYAEARSMIADAVDKEIDNWKKYVVTYFERREENLRGRMRIKDLYDMSADQRLRLRDTAMRRRYETMKNHPELTRNSVATGDALNFMLARFAGTPIGYGISLDEVFQGNPAHTRWNVTPEMHHQLIARTTNIRGASREFRLDQPTAIAFDWPGLFYIEEKFKPHLNLVGRLQDELDDESKVIPAQVKVVGRLQDAFAELTRQFFKVFGVPGTRGGYDNQTILQIRQAEDFLNQKSRELSMFVSNPTAAMHQRNIFDPKNDGKDAGTLISFMSRNGLRFAKPRDGEDAAYHALFSMMLELYAMYGEPAAQIAKTDVPVKPTPIKQQDGNPATPLAAPLGAVLDET